MMLYKKALYNSGKLSLSIITYVSLIVFENICILNKISNVENQLLLNIISIYLLLYQVLPIIKEPIEKHIVNHFIDNFKKHQRIMIKHALSHHINTQTFDKNYLNYKKYISFYMKAIRYGMHFTGYLLGLAIYHILNGSSYQEILNNKVFYVSLLAFELIIIGLFIFKPSYKKKAIINHNEFTKIQKNIKPNSNNIPNFIDNKIKFYYINITIFEKIAILSLIAFAMWYYKSSVNILKVILYLVLSNNSLITSLSKWIIFINLYSQVKPKVLQKSKIKKTLKLNDREMYPNKYFDKYYIVNKKYNISLLELINSMKISPEKFFYIIDKYKILNDTVYTMDFLLTPLSSMTHSSIKNLFNGIAAENDHIIFDQGRINDFII